MQDLWQPIDPFVDRIIIDAYPVFSEGGAPRPSACKQARPLPRGCERSPLGEVYWLVRGLRIVTQFSIME